MRVVEINYHPSVLGHLELKRIAFIKTDKLIFQIIQNSHSLMVKKTPASKLESSSEKAHKLLPALVPGPLQGRSVYNELKKHQAPESVGHAAPHSVRGSGEHLRPLSSYL